jgi:hypothetical protein
MTPDEMKDLVAFMRSLSSAGAAVAMPNLPAR